MAYQPRPVTTPKSAVGEQPAMPTRLPFGSLFSRLSDDAGYMASGAYPAKVSDLQGIAADINALLDSHADLVDALKLIAEGTAPPIPHGHYLAHRHAVNIARSALNGMTDDGAGHCTASTTDPDRAPGTNTNIPTKDQDQ